MSPFACLPPNPAQTYDGFLRFIAANSAREARVLFLSWPGEIMTQRINYVQQSPELLKKFFEFSNLLKDSAIEESIRDLVSIRASQINGCARHVRAARTCRARLDGSADKITGARRA